MAKLMRLDKYLVEMNKGSRTQIKDAAKKGRIPGKWCAGEENRAKD